MSIKKGCTGALECFFVLYIRLLWAFDNFVRYLYDNTTNFTRRASDKRLHLAACQKGKKSYRDVVEENNSCAGDCLNARKYKRGGYSFILYFFSLYRSTRSLRPSFSAARVCMPPVSFRAASIRPRSTVPSVSCKDPFSS
jgi:hypothetical protein